MAYLVGIKNGVVPCGNPGLLRHNYLGKSPIMSLAIVFRKQHNLDQVYNVPELTQEMCEMNAEQLALKVKEVGTSII